jgi:hypothetical protein
MSSTNEGGIAFIETASLDGEKNLKPRNAYEVTNKLINEDSLRSFSGKFTGEPPNK